MKKLIISLASVILLALLGLAGLNQIKQNGPRGRVISPTGSKVIVEEMSYYVNGEKYSGRCSNPQMRTAISPTRWVRCLC